MKRNIFYRFGITLICLSVSLFSYASRPIWVIGHGANYLGSAEAALNHGANGVEIDVRAKESYAKDHWSVDHKEYWTKDQCDKGEGRSYVFSLEKYLEQPIMNDPRMRVLWIDCKNEDYMVDLINLVHSLTPNGTPYSIIYGCYSAKTLEKYGTEIRKLLRDNEGINLGDKDISAVQPWIGNEPNKIPKEKHFYTRGYYRSSMKNKNHVIDARKLRDENNAFCTKVGFWTCDWMSEARICVDNEYAQAETNFDLVLAYYPEGLLPVATLRKWVLPDFVKGVVNDSKVNKGRWHIAGKGDKFWPTEK